MKMARDGWARATAEKYADITGALICGGKSKRFGSDKRLYVVQGERLFDLGFSKLKAVSDDVVAVFREDIPPVLKNYPSLYDDERAEGPLAGLLAALAYTRRSHLLVMPCDTPHLSIDFLRFLCLNKASGKVVIPRTCRLEPLIGMYPKSIHQRLLDYVQKGAKNGTKSLRHFIEGLPDNHKKLIQPSAWQKAGFSMSEFENFNKRPGNF